MNVNNELNFQVDDLKNKISSLFQKFESMQSGMTMILNMVKSNPEYNLTKNKLEMLVDLSNKLNSTNNIDEFYEIKSLAYDVEKMIFDLEHIIEGNETNPEIIVPEIKTALLEDMNSTLLGSLKNVIDPEMRLNNVEYSLYKELPTGTTQLIKTLVQSESMFDVDFNFRENGRFYFVATYYYSVENNIIENKTIKSNTVTVQVIEKEMPSICCAALTSLGNTPKGLLTEVEDIDRAITTITYVLKNENSSLVETKILNNPYEHVQFGDVLSGNYYFEVTCKYDIGISTGEIKLESNLISIKK
ncbi:MAG: hypothetical protein ACRCYT_08855 [Cetobacterium sp.]